MFSEALATAIVHKELALGGVWVADLNLLSWSRFEFIGEAEGLSLPTFFCLKGLCFASQPRETGRCSDSKQLFLLSAKHFAQLHSSMFLSLSQTLLQQIAALQHSQ